MSYPALSAHLDQLHQTLNDLQTTYEPFARLYNKAYPYDPDCTMCQHGWVRRPDIAPCICRAPQDFISDRAERALSWIYGAFASLAAPTEELHADWIHDEIDITVRVDDPAHAWPAYAQRVIALAPDIARILHADPYASLGAWHTTTHPNSTRTGYYDIAGPTRVRVRLTLTR